MLLRWNLITPRNALSIIKRVFLSLVCHLLTKTFPLPLSQKSSKNSGKSQVNEQELKDASDAVESRNILPDLAGKSGAAPEEFPDSDDVKSPSIHSYMNNVNLWNGCNCRLFYNKFHECANEIFYGILKGTADAFTLSFTPQSNVTYTAQELHRMLGHADQKRMKAFLDTNPDCKMRGKFSDIADCGVCAEIDQIRKKPPASTSPLQADGPNKCFVDTWFAETESLGGATCAHDVLDHKSGQVKTFPVRRKGNFLIILMHIIQTMYTQYGRTLHQINTDNAWELGAAANADESVRRWLLHRGIHHLTSAPYAHGQVGSVERLHRTINKGMRAALRDSGCPEPFWALARCWYCEILNNIPNR